MKFSMLGFLPASLCYDSGVTPKPQLDVVAHITAKPGEEALVREVLESYIAPTRLEEGCLRYDLFVDVEDAAQFTFIEEWTSAELLFKHSQSAHLAAGGARLKGKLTGDPQVLKLPRIC
jgi:quinol monooxygenase YgiN